MARHRLGTQRLTAIRSYAVETALVGLVAAFLIFYVDIPLALRLSHGSPGGAIGGDPVWLLDGIAHLGRAEYYLAAALPGMGIGLWLLRRPEQRRQLQGWTLLYAGTLIAGTLAVGHLLVLLLKQMVARLRPSELVREGLHGFADPFSGEPFTSMPSSHCFTAFAMAAVFSRLRPDLRAMFFGAALLVAVQRMLTHHHFLSDIFISLFLALMVSEVAHAAWRAGAPALAGRLPRV